MEQHISYATQVISNEIRRINKEIEYGHHIQENIQAMQLDVLRLETAISDIEKRFDK